MKHLFIGLSILALGLISYQTISYSNNPPLSRTSAPDESNCTSCHGGTAITSGTDYNNLKITTTMKSSEYLPDSTYKISIDYSETGKSKFGFQSTTLTASKDERCGTYTVTNSTKTGKNTASVKSKTREYIYHKSGGTSGSGGTSWDFEWTAPKANEGSVIFYVAVNSTNSDNGTKGDKIILKEFEFKPSALLPSAKITTNKSVCAGDTLVLDGSNSKNAKTYAWKPAGNSFVSSKTDATIKAVWTTPGSYNIRLTTSNTFGSSLEETVKITVMSSPKNTVTITPNDTVCAGDTIQLKADDGMKWSWSSAETSQQIDILKAGKYSLTVEGTNGCTSLNEDINLTFNGGNTLNISSSSQDTLCTNDSINVVLSSGYSSYSITNNSSLFSSVSNQSKVPVFPGANAITAIGIDASGCFSAESSTLKFFGEAQKNGPILSCGAAGIETLKLEWTADPDVLSYEVSTDMGANWLAANGAGGIGHELTGLNFGTQKDFMVRGTVATKCQFTQVTTKSCKTKNCFQAHFITEIKDNCSNLRKGELTLTDLNVSRYSVSFNGGTHVRDSVFRFDPSTTPIGTNALKIELIDSNALSCPAFDTTITFQNYLAPSPSITFDFGLGVKQNRICEAGDVVELKGTKWENGMAYSSRLFRGTNITADANDSAYYFDPTGLVPGKYAFEYAVTTSQGCGIVIADEVIIDSTIELSIDSKDKIGLEVQYSSIIKGTKKWEWNFGDGNSSELRNPTHRYNNDGYYVITLSSTDNEHGCGLESVKDSFELVSGIAENTSSLSVYPVPFHNQLIVKSENNIGAIQLISITGETIYQSEALSKETIINTSDLSKGIYLLIIRSDDTIYSRKIIKN